MTERREQLRRLKNTVMGAGNRLNLLGRSGELGPQAETELRAMAAELSDVARRLERILTGLREEV